jgi:hypothetical protein
MGDWVMLLVILGFTCEKLMKVRLEVGRRIMWLIDEG